MHTKVQSFIETYGLFQDDTIQQIQLQHRFSLVEAFAIQPGMTVLEIGCGQGDTTVALADAVGPNGHVIALDVADGDYGAPFTLAQAHERIQTSSIGDRIDFHLNTDFLDWVSPVHIDAIVLSHCSWYFQDASLLAAYFHKMNTLTKRICFAEWSMQIDDISQRGHFHAVSILALYSAFIENDGNIQHVFSASQIEQFARDAHFTLRERKSVDAHYLQDGEWEKAYANELVSDFTKAPHAIQALVSTYAEAMNQDDNTFSLNSVVLLFEREADV